MQLASLMPGACSTRLELLKLRMKLPHLPQPHLPQPQLQPTRPDLKTRNLLGVMQHQGSGLRAHRLRLCR